MAASPLLDGLKWLRIEFNRSAAMIGISLRGQRYQYQTTRRQRWRKSFAMKNKMWGRQALSYLTTPALHFRPRVSDLVESRGKYESMTGIAIPSKTLRLSGPSPLLHGKQIDSLKSSDDVG